MKKENYIEEALRPLKESGNLIDNVEIDTITGIRPENDVQNKLFIWGFEKEDAKNLLNIYDRFSEKNINYKTLDKLKNDLIKEGREIEKKGIYPVEVILYTSKTINNRLKDVSLVDTLSRVIGHFIQKNSIDAIKVLKHIIKNWTWVEQLKIAILSLNFIEEFELLSLIYDEYSSDISLKYEVFKTLLNSKNDECIEMILNMVSYLDSDFECDRKIGNLFKDKFDIFYPLHGLKRAQELYNSGASISYFGKKTLSKVVDTDVKVIEENQFELGNMINLAKKSFSNNKKIFEYAFLEGGRSRQASVKAMSFSREKEDVSEFLYNLYLENKQKLNIYDSMNICITLALCNSRRSLDVCKDYKHKDYKFKPYEYACRFLLGDELAAQLLAHELITGEHCSENNTTMRAVRPCLFKSLLPQKIEEEFSKLVSKCSEKELISYLINIKAFLKSSKKSPGIIIELEKICGHKTQESNAYKLFKKSEKLQKVFMNVMVDLVNVDTINIYEKMLFSIANNNSLSQQTRVKARNIVSDLVDVAPPTV